MRFQVGHKTDVGRVRQGNEDNYLVDHTMNLFAVADGMGGHRAGEVASHTALAELRSLMEADPELHVAAAVAAANDAVFQKAVDDPSLQGMGTTVTAVKMIGETAVLGHVGDSRAYLLRTGVLLRVTQDHSFVEQLRREGRITAEQAAVHPQRSILTRALGIEPGVAIDRELIDLVHGDRLMLCSDGLHALVGEHVIKEILLAVADPMAAAEALIVAANEAGGDDNITAVVIDVYADGVQTDPSSAGAVDLVGAGAASGDTVQLSAPELDGVPAAIAAALASGSDDPDATVEIPEIPEMMAVPEAVDAPTPTGGHEPSFDGGDLGGGFGTGVEPGVPAAPSAPFAEPPYADVPFADASTAGAVPPPLPTPAGERTRSPWLWMIPVIVVLGVALGLIIWLLAR